MQFTEANKADQLAKLSEARAAEVGMPLQKFKFVSALNEQVNPPPPFLIMRMHSLGHKFIQSHSASAVCMAAKLDLGWRGGGGCSASACEIILLLGPILHSKCCLKTSKPCASLKCKP